MEKTGVKQGGGGRGRERLSEGSKKEDRGTPSGESNVMGMSQEREREREGERE